MFGDALTLEQCQRLVAQLGLARHPFICAHGRPTTVPLLVLPAQDEDHIAMRPIDWAEWKRKSLEAVGMTA